MCRVDFYILKERSATAIFPFLCKLLEKGYKAGNRFFVKLPNEQDAKKLDALLWTYSDISFLPHHLIEDHTILLGVHAKAGSEDSSESPEILVNLRETIPERDKIDTLQRIIEVVPDEEPWKSHSRKKYRGYKEAGSEIKTHTIS